MQATMANDQAVADHAATLDLDSIFGERAVISPQEFINHMIRSYEGYTFDKSRKLIDVLIDDGKVKLTDRWQVERMSIRLDAQP